MVRLEIEINFLEHTGEKNNFLFPFFHGNLVAGV
jgi:hypothetical protein